MLALVAVLVLHATPTPNLVPEAPESPAPVVIETSRPSAVAPGLRVTVEVLSSAVGGLGLGLLGLWGGAQISPGFEAVGPMLLGAAVGGVVGAGLGAWISGWAMGRGSFGTAALGGMSGALVGGLLGVGLQVAAVFLAFSFPGLTLLAALMPVAGAVIGVEWAAAISERSSGARIPTAMVPVARF